MFLALRLFILIVRFSLLHRKSQSNVDLRRNDSVSVIVHDIVVVGPITATNLSLSKGLAAEHVPATCYVIPISG